MSRKVTIVIGMVCAGLLATSNVSGQPTTWDGTFSEEWNDPLNWTAGVPTNTTNAVFDGSGDRLSADIGAIGGDANVLDFTAGGHTIFGTGVLSLSSQLRNLAGENTISAAISGASTGIIVSGSGSRLTLSGDNSLMTGAVNIGAGAELYLTTNTSGGTGTISLGGGKLRLAENMVPPTVTSQDIGDEMNVAGSDIPIGGSWTEAGGSITAEGPDIWDADDDFRFVYTQVTGDFDVSVDVTGMPVTHNGWQKAGIMARKSLVHNSENVIMLVSRDNGVNLQHRVSDGASTGGPSNNRDEEWDTAQSVRLTRVGDVFTGYYKHLADTAWIQLPTGATDDLGGGAIYLGLAMTSHSNDNLGTSTFENATLFAPVPYMAYGSNVVVTAAGSVIELEGGTPAEMGTLSVDPTAGVTIHGPGTTWGAVTIGGGGSIDANSPVTGMSLGIGGTSQVGVRSTFTSDYGPVSDSASPATLLKTGGGRLNMLDTTGATSLLAASKVKIQQGTVAAKSTRSTGGDNSLGDAEAVLDGGELEVEGYGVSIINALAASRYTGGWADDDLRPWGAYSDPENGETFIGTARLGLTPVERGTETGEIRYQRNAEGGRRNWNELFPATGGGDNSDFQVFWTGQFTPDEDGTWGFKFSASDDRCSFFLDRNDNGVFDNPDDQINWDSGGFQTVPGLVKDQTYNIAIGFGEWGGGDNIEARFQRPSGGDTIIDPSAQAGMWQTFGVVGDADFTNTNVSVTGDGTISVIHEQANFGSLTMADANTLTLDGSITFTGTTLQGSATLAPMRGTSEIGPITVPGSPHTLATAAGSTGTLNLTSTAPGARPDNLSTILIQGATVSAMLRDSNSSLGEAKVKMDGGKLVLHTDPGAPGSPADAIGYWSFDNVAGPTVVNDGTNGTYSDGTLTGGALIAAGKYNNGVSLDGIAAYVDVGNDANLNVGAGDWTIAGWASSTKVTGTADANKATLYCHGSDQGGGHRIQVSLNEQTAGNWSLTTDDDASKVQAKSTDAIGSGEWHHVAAMRDGDQIRIFVDGAPADASTGVPGGYDLSGINMSNARIGVSDSTGSGLIKWMQGMIDEVYLYSRALRLEEIMALMDAENGFARQGPDLTDYGTEIEVLSASALEIDGGIKLGDMKLYDTGVLEVIGEGSLVVPSVEIGGGGGSVGINAAAGIDVTISQYTDIVAWTQNTTFGIGGGGRVIFDDLVAATSDANTLFNVTAGSLIVLNDMPVAGFYRSTLPKAAFHLDGGRLEYISADGNDLPLTNALTVGANGGTLYTGNAGGLGGGAMTLSLTAPIDITGGVLTFETDSGYVIDANGHEIKGAGGVTLTGGGRLHLLTGDANWTGPTTVDGGTLYHLVPLDDTSGIDVLNGKLFSANVIDIAGDLYVGPGGEIDAWKPVTVGNAVFEGSATFRNVSTTLTTTGSIIVNSGLTTVGGKTTTTLLRANGGTFVGQVAIEASGAVDANGGTIRALNTLEAAEILVHNSGRLEASNVITLTTGDGNDITLDSGGILTAKHAGALSTLPDFHVGPLGRLSLAVPQTAIPVITVQTGGMIDGNMTGAVYSGAGQNVVFQNNAVYGGVPGNDPNTNDLGPLPPTGVRLMRAILGGSSGEIIPVGDDANAATIDDIYFGATYGPWTTAQFIGTLNVNNVALVDIPLMGRDETLDSTATFNVMNPASEVRFTGAGSLTIPTPISGTAKFFSRLDEPPTGTPQFTDDPTLTLADGAVAGGQIWSVANGVVNVQSDDTFDSNQDGLVLLDGALWDMHSPDRRVNHGRITLGTGSMTRIHDRDDRFNQDTNDVIWTFQPGARVIFRKENVDMVGLNWPTNALYIFDNEGTNNSWKYDRPFLISDGGGWIGRQGGNTGFDGGQDADGNDNHGGPQAALGAQVGDTVTIAVPFEPGNPGNRDTRSFYIRDAFDLRFQEDANYALNLNIGDPEPMLTVIGNNDATLVDTLMSGRLNVECSFLVGDVYHHSGYVNFEMGRADSTRVDDLVQVLRIDDYWGGGGYDTRTGAHEGADVAFRQIANFNAGGQRSIRGKIYWHGEEMWIDSDQYFKDAFHTTDPNQMFAEEICIGSASRFSFAFDRASQSGPWGNVRIIPQPFRMQAADGNTPHWGWNFKPRRAGGSGSQNTYFPNFVMEEGSVLAPRSDNSRFGFDLTFEGDASVVRRDNDANYVEDTYDWWYINDMRVAEGFGPAVTATIGEMNQSNAELRVYGQLGDANGDMTLNLVRGVLRFYEWSDLAPNTIINHLGDDGFGAGADGYIEIFNGKYGDQGDPNRFVNNGTMRIGGGQDIRLRITRDNAPGDVPYVHELNSRVEIVPDGDADSIDGYVQAQREGGNQRRPFGFYTNVHVLENARVRFERHNETEILANLFMDGNGFIRLNSDGDCHIGNITGPGTATFEGGDRTRIVGVVDANIVWNSSDWVELTNDQDGDFQSNGLDLGFGAGFSMTPGHSFTILRNRAELRTNAGTGITWNAQGGRIDIGYEFPNLQGVVDPPWIAMMEDDANHTVNISNNGQLRFHLNDTNPDDGVGTREDELHKVDWDINVFNADADPGTRDGIIRAHAVGNDHGDNGWGVAHLTDLHLDEGAFVRFEEWAGRLVMELTLDGNARVDPDNHHSFGFGRIDGNGGTLTVTDSGAMFMGEVIDTDIDIQTGNWSHFGPMGAGAPGTPDALRWTGGDDRRLWEAWRGAETMVGPTVGGFKLNGGTVWADGHVDIWNDPNGGVFDARGGTGKQFRIMHGRNGTRENPVTFETPLVIHLGNNDEIRPMVYRDGESAQNGTNSYYNKLTAEVHVYSNGNSDTGQNDVRLRGDWYADGNPAYNEEAIVHYTDLNIHGFVTAAMNRDWCDILMDVTLHQEGAEPGHLYIRQVNAGDDHFLGNVYGEGTITYHDDDDFSLIGRLNPNVVFNFDNTRTQHDRVLRLIDQTWQSFVDDRGGQAGHDHGDYGYADGFTLNGSTVNVNMSRVQLWCDPSDANGGHIWLNGRSHVGGSGNAAMEVYYGRDWQAGGSTWGDSSAVVHITQDRGIRFIVHDDATEQINMTFRVEPDTRAWIRADEQGHGGADGVLVLPNVNLAPNSVLETWRDDNVYTVIGGTVDDGTHPGRIHNRQHGGRGYLYDWGGDGTLEIGGTEHTRIVGRIASGGFQTASTAGDHVYFTTENFGGTEYTGVLAAGHVYFEDPNTEVHFDGNSTIDAGIVDFDGQPLFFRDGMDATMDMANLNVDPGFNDNMNLDIGTANFNTDMDMRNVNLTVDLGVVRAEVTVDDCVGGGDEHWRVHAGGHLIAQGVGSLDGTAPLIELIGGRADLEIDSSVTLPAAVKATGVGAEPILHVTGAGTGETVTFPSLLLEDDTDNPIISISSANDYNVAFGSTTLDSADRGQINVITAGTDVDLGPVTITSGTLGMDAVAGAMITVGPLDSGGDAAARLEFGRGGTYSGGGLILSDSDPNKWAGTIYVDNATLVIDSNFDGYDQGYHDTDPNNPSIIVGRLSMALGTRAITKVTYDSTVEGMTMHEYATLGLQLSNTMKDVVGPTGIQDVAYQYGDAGLAGGNLILDFADIDASFRQSDGNGGSMNMMLIEDAGARPSIDSPLYSDPTGVISTLAGANYHAPLDLIGTILLGDPDGLGEDFEISGIIADGCSPIEDLMWNVLGELMPGKLIKVGGEAVTLSHANTFTGGVDANEGTLVMADTLALGDITGPGLSLQGGTLRIAAADANFDAAAGGYAFSMTDDSTVEVNAAGANLKPVLLGDGTLVINDQMVGATAPSAGPGPGALTVINVPDVSVDYVVGLQGTLDVPASATIHAIEDFGAADANTLFNIGAGQTLTIDDNETLDANRIWNVAGGTVLYSGDLTTTHTLRKAGDGTLTLAGANNSIPDLVIGTSPGGTVIVTSAGKVPDSVLIEAGSLYTVQKGDHNYNEVAAASAGIAALSAGSNAAIDFSDNTAYLGAVVDSTYSGDLTPSAAGYFLGGGGGRLTVDDLLADTPLAPNADAALGWADSHDNNVLFTEGVALLNAENTLTGNVQVNMETIYLKKAFEKVESADGNWVWVNPGGMLDLNSTGAREDNIKVNGGAIANTGGTLDAGAIQNMFQTGDYMIGSNSGGSTGYGDGGFVRPDANLWKVGTDTAVMLDPIGGGDSNNTYAADVADPNVIRGHTTIQGGTLEIYNPTSLAYSGDLNIQNGTALVMRSGGNLDANVYLQGTIEILDGSTLSITDANCEFVLQDGTSSFLGEGATLDLGPISYRHAGGGHGVDATRFLYLGPNTTMLTAYGGPTADAADGPQDNALIIGENAKVQYTSAGFTLRAIGEMHRGATVQFDVAVNVGTGDEMGLRFNVDPFTGVVSTYDDPYHIGGEGDYIHSPDGDNGAILSPVLSNGDSPTAYVEKFGSGTVELGGRSYQPGQYSAAPDVYADYGRARKFYWIVSEGTLAMAMDADTDSSALGATAYTWLNPTAEEGGVALDPNVGHAHLEGIEVFSGAELRWGGTQGFLPESRWIAEGGTDEDGNGFEPGELILHDGATLSGNANGLTLGFTQQVGDPCEGQTFLCYPTVAGPKADRTLKLSGNINFRSGIEVLGGGTVRLEVTNGTIDLSADLPGALPLDTTVTEMDLTASTVTVRNDHSGMTQTNVGEGSELVFDGNAATVYNGTVFNDGLVRAATGDVDLGTTMIESSPTLPETWYSGLVGGGLVGNMDQTTPNPGNIGLSAGPEAALQAFGGNPRQAYDPTNPWHYNGPLGDGLGDSDNKTMVYTGQIWLDGNKSFVEQIDDQTRLWITDPNTGVRTQVLSNTSWNEASAAMYVPASGAGWYEFELRMSNGTGGYGFFNQQNTGAGDANWDVVDFGFGMADGNTGGSTNALDYAYPEDPDNMSLFRAWYQPILGRIQVDANATISLGGFTHADLVTIDGNMVFNGASQSSAHELVINEGGLLDLGSAALNQAEIGVIRGTLRGTNVAVFDDLTIEGAGPVIDLGTGLLRATDARVNTDFSFGPGVKSTFETLAVNANVSVDPGGELGVSSMAAVSGGGKLSLNGGNAADLEAVTVDGGELAITDGNGLNSGMGINNDGKVLITNNATVDLTDTVITSSGMTPQVITGEDIGNPAGAGSHSEAAGTWTVTGDGGDIWGGSDSFYFVYTEWTGDFAVTIDLTDFSIGTNGWRKAGIMARNSTAANSRNAYMSISGTNGASFQLRTTDGGDSDSRHPGSEQWPSRIKLTREGDLFRGFVDASAPFGDAWTELWTDRPICDMDDTILLGLGVTSHEGGGALATATFDSANFFQLPTELTVDAGSKLMVGGFTNAGIVTPAGTLELHDPLVTSTAEMVTIPEGGVMDIRASSLDANYGSLSGSLLGDGTGLAKFRTQLTVEDAPDPAINLSGGPLEVAGEMLVRKDNFAFDAGHAANIGTLNMEGPISVKIESTGNVTADLINVGEDQTLVLKGGTTNITHIDNNGALVKAEVGENDLSDTIIRSPGGVPGGLPYDVEVMADNPELYYRFEDSGATAVDETGNHNGTYLNQATPGQPTAYPALGTAVEFDGTDDSVSIDETLTSEKMTIETWFYGDNMGGWRSVLNSDGWAAGRLHFQFNGHPLRWCINGNGGDVLMDTFTYNASTWYHMATTYDGVTGQVKMYVDGNEVYSGSDNGNNDPIILNGNIGAWNGNDREWDGRMDEFAVYYSVLDADRVKAHYEAGTGAGGGIFGTIEVDSGAVLKVKGFENAGTVTVGSNARLELGQHDSTCLDLELDPTGLLDVGQSLEIMYDSNTTLADVRNDILAGRGGGGWSGSNWVGGNWNGTTGITSSVIRAGHRDEWSLVAIDPNTLNSDDEILIRITIIGDIDVDEDVDHDDLAILEANFGQTGGWAEGDVDLSGVVDFRDYLLWKAFEGRTYTGPGAGIPEPATMVLLAFGGVAVLARRRRRK